MLTLELFENDDEFAPSQRVKQQIQVDRHPLREYLSYEEFEQLMDQFDTASFYTENSHEAADTYLELLAQISNLGFDEIFYNIIEDWIQERYGSNRFGIARAEINTALIDDLNRAFRQTWTETKPRITVYHMVDKMSKVSNQMSNFSELETYDDQMDESEDDLFANKPSVKEQIVRLLNDISNDYYDNAEENNNDDDEIDEMLVIAQQVADVSDQFGKDISSGLRAWHDWLDEPTREEVRGEILHNLKIDIQGMYDSLLPINENEDDMFALPRMTRTQYLIVSMMKQRLERGMNPDDAVWQVADELDMDKYDVIGEFPDSLVKELEDTGLWENKNNDDLFANRVGSWVKNIQDVAQYSVDGWLDVAHDPVNYRNIEIGYEGVEAVKEFTKGMESGLRAWYQLDDELRDRIAASIKDELEIDFYAMYDSLPVNEESDGDMFAASDRIKQVMQIRNSPERALDYAKDVIGGRWPEAEPVIMKSPRCAFYYAKDVIKGRWPEAEPYIMKNPEWAYWYAQKIIRRRWAKAEPYIMKNPEWAYSYARGVFKGRWPEAEPVIMRDPREAMRYARDVIKDRWLEAEPVIRQSEWEKIYRRYFDIRGKLKENDDLFAEPTDQTDIAEALLWLSKFWNQRAEDQGDESWSRDADQLRYAASLFARGGMMPGVNALNEIDRWEVIGDDFEYWHADEWQKLEQYLNNINENDIDAEELDAKELDADTREANLQRFWATSHLDTQKRLYRGQRRAPKPDRFVTTKGRETPSFTDDPEVANVYSRQLDWDVAHGPGSTSVPVYLQMNKPLDIRGLGEYFNLLDFVAVLPNVDLSQESIPNGLGYYDLYMMLSDLDELVYKTGAKSEIEASGSEGLYTIRDFEELAGEVITSGEEGDVNQIEYMLSETQLDSFIIADSSDIVRRLEKMGYDGVILSDIFSAGAPYYQGDVNKLQTGAWDDEEKVITAYRPFHQGKIKSAIGNKGTYNTADPDITREDTL